MNVSMARDIEADFVLTVSDNDHVSDEEEEELPAPTKRMDKGTKRRRTEDRNGFQNGSSKKARSAGPLLNGHENAHRQDAQGDGEHDAGQDDGAIDPDFEFGAENANEGTMDDFDAWEPEGSTKLGAHRREKTGVDIDDLITRRKERIALAAVKKKKAKATNGVSMIESGSEASEPDSDDLDGDIGINSASDSPEGEAADAADDEVLAPDGFGMGAMGDDEEGESIDGEEDDDSDESIDAVSASPVPHPDDGDSASDDDPVQRQEDEAAREAFFAPEPKPSKKSANRSNLPSFQSMSLSRPILRGLAALNFADPTPIQARTIPLALLGKDIVGGAVTGSGKTAAFVVPILERLLYRPRTRPTTRVAILVPTRELAVQCVGVARRLAAHTDIAFATLVGGLSLREQEAALRARPDVVVATPGRFIDHVRNSAGFTVESLEILVLDEADRMLDDGFADELNEILTSIPRSRQTMLFSATMTDRVDCLVRMGLNRPARVLVDARAQTVATLTQEFVRLRPGREDRRLAHVLHLCATAYPARVIVFFRQKKVVHRARVLFALLGFKAAELHGSITQEQRLHAVEAFRAGTVTHLLATDVAARGLDIRGVDAVLNAEAPQTHDLYLHRVGRTARAGRKGRACTLAAEPDRRVVKQAVKAARAQNARVVNRKIDAKDVDAWDRKISALDDEVEAVLREEKEEKALGRAEMELKRGENLVEHEREIMSRPKRTWFESETDKRKAKKRSREELNRVGGKKADRDGLDKKRQQMKAKGGGKLSGKDMKRLDDTRARTQGKVWKKGPSEKSPKGKGGSSKSKKGKAKAEGKAKSK